jgi:hypothetical protein
MKDDRKAVIADHFRQLVSNVHPNAIGAIHSINAAVALLIEPFRQKWMKSHAVRVVTILWNMLKKVVVKGARPISTQVTKRRMFHDI